MSKSRKYDKDRIRFDDGKTTRKEALSMFSSDICNCKNPYPVFDELGEYCDGCGKEI